MTPESTDPSLAGTLALYGVLGISLVIAAWRAPWRVLVARRERQHAMFATLLILPVLWLGSVDAIPGAHLHLLGMTPVVLVFGWPLALLFGTAAAVGLAALGPWTFAALPGEVALTVAIPVAVTQGLLWAADRAPHGNLFVYALGVGFIGGALSMTASLLAGAAFRGWTLDHATALLLAFPEGFIDGAVVTALAVFYPALLRTFDEDRYYGPP